MKCTNRQNIGNVNATIRGVSVTLDLDVEIFYDYDRGVWRTPNGDGEPPSLEIEETRIISTVAEIREQIGDIDVYPPITDAEINMCLDGLSETLGELADTSKFDLHDDSENHWDDEPPECDDDDNN